MSFNDLPEVVRAEKFWCAGCKEVVSKMFMSKTFGVCNHCFRKNKYRLEMFKVKNSVTQKV